MAGGTLLRPTAERGGYHLWDNGDAPADEYAHPFTQAMLKDVFRQRARQEDSGAVAAVAEQEAADDGNKDGEHAMEVDTTSTIKGNHGGSCDAAAGGKPPRPPPLSLAGMGATGGPGSGRSMSFTTTPSSSVGTPQSPGVDRAGMPRLGSRCAVCLVQKKASPSPALVSQPF